MRQILSVSGNSVNLEDLADMADKMMEIYPDSHCVNAIQNSSKEDTSTIFNIQQQLTQLISHHCRPLSQRSIPDQLDPRLEEEQSPDSALGHLSGQLESVGII